MYVSRLILIGLNITSTVFEINQSGFKTLINSNSTLEEYKYVFYRLLLIYCCIPQKYYTKKQWILQFVQRKTDLFNRYGAIH